MNDHDEHNMDPAPGNGMGEQRKLFSSEAVFPASLVAEAIRSGPYSTSANAIAELVDNSYDANASEIHIALICAFGKKRPQVIGVLDNGNGMDADTLRHSVQHGRHQRQPTKRSRIGKFGVGLLSASFNQCKSLEVYSWTNGLRDDGVNATSIQVKDCPEELPKVTQKPLPSFFNSAFEQFDRVDTRLDTHGTLVVWRELDRLTWRTASTLSEKLEFEIGRIYRNFLANHQHPLKVVISHLEEGSVGGYCRKGQRFVRPVDPLFLNNWDCTELKKFQDDLKKVRLDPEKYNISQEELRMAGSKPTLFIPYNIENEVDNATHEDGTMDPLVAEIVRGGQVIGKYRILASFRRPKFVRAAAAEGGADIRNPGKTPYGKLAERLRGVSILRGGREIALDANWLRADLTIDRWVSLSIDFDPSLDFLFGISNDKQRAGHLSALAQVNTKEMDPKASEYDNVMLEVAKRIHLILGRLRRRVGGRDKPNEVQTSVQPTSTDPSHESRQNLEIYTRILKNRAAREPHVQIIGVDDREPDKDRITSALDKATLDDQPASKSRPAFIVEHKLKVDFVTDPIASGSDLFTPLHNESGVMIVRLHKNHPLYSNLQEILQADNEEPEAIDDVGELQAKLKQAIATVRGLFLSFSRAELESDPRMRKIFERVRHEWSFIAQDIFDPDE